MRTVIADLKNAVKDEDYDVEKIYIALRKLFALRKSYLAIPIKSIQDKVDPDNVETSIMFCIVIFVHKHDHFFFFLRLLRFFS